MAMPRRVLEVREFPAYRASWHFGSDSTGVRYCEASLVPANRQPFGSLLALPPLDLTPSLPTRASRLRLLIQFAVRTAPCS